MGTRCLGGFSIMWVTKLLISPVKKRIWPKIGIFGQFGPGLFSALLMGRLVVVARGLYLARHLFTLLSVIDCHKPHSIASQFVHHVHHNSHYNAHSCPTYLGQLLQIANDEDVGATVLSNILTR